MSTLVLPKVWGSGEEMLPADLNANLQAVALALNNITDSQMVAGAGIPNTKFSTTPGSRVTAAQVVDKQVTEPKLADGSVFTEQAVNNKFDDPFTPISIGVAVPTLLGEVLATLTGMELVTARVKGLAFISQTAPFSSVCELSLQVNGVGLDGHVPPQNKARLVAERTVSGALETLPWSVELVGLQSPTFALPRVYAVYGQQVAPGAGWDCTGVEFSILDLR